VHGREAEFSELLRTTIGDAEARGEGPALTTAEFLTGGLYNGLGRYEAALGIEARLRALLSDGDAADELYQHAIRRLGRTRVRVQLARTHLLYGERSRLDCSSALAPSSTTYARRSASST
jgi:hypothetical protein